ncbi:hypothetical protein Pmar_PMAR000550 [Perkinsus marinus ATCC 50983]|uniref:Uncharacterized protein n=1 Tax=Perkinsus marinus (strain ATCC 50983 / TXsc) TaxID=423536 RepID=C5LIX8_PERM5|nr:hypothetical protein Pmar_PMAR000550 [Perkinsus marinus ATCC 50983]EER03313.1 hypothetical protein Pmar_PMAR000550 [Perkinsus marinus ATCC 50983]|eukprot:XP_002771497.1 hypothetical protein Pmar_PMAR000550 [Perkinsus marinus ATCC 50983]
MTRGVVGSTDEVVGTTAIVVGAIDVIETPGVAVEAGNVVGWVVVVDALEVIGTVDVEEISTTCNNFQGY